MAAKRTHPKRDRRPLSRAMAKEERDSACAAPVVGRFDDTKISSCFADVWRSARKKPLI